LKLTITKAVIGYFTRELWLPDWYKEYRKRSHESARVSAIFNTLKKESKLEIPVQSAIPREDLVKLVSAIIPPTEMHRSYPIIIGEHGTGKTGLIALALEKVEEPSSIAYINVPSQSESYVVVIGKMRKALGYRTDPIIDSDEGSRSNSLHVVSWLIN
jgi:hypothetical protein